MKSIYVNEPEKKEDLTPFLNNVAITLQIAACFIAICIGAKNLEKIEKKKKKKRKKK